MILPCLRGLGFRVQGLGFRVSQRSHGDTSLFARFRV